MRWDREPVFCDEVQHAREGAIVRSDEKGRDRHEGFRFGDVIDLFYPIRAGDTPWQGELSGGRSWGTVPESSMGVSTRRESSQFARGNPNRVERAL